jgi:hypothetical protein
MRPLAPPARDEIRPEDLKTYDRAAAYWLPMAASDATAGRAAEHPWIAALMHSPPFALHRGELSALVRTAGERDDTYSHSDREFVDMVLAAHLKTNVVQTVHIPDAIATGIRPEAIEALYEGRDPDLTDDERLLATYIRQVVDGNVTEESFAAMVERLGTRGVVEYTYFITVLWTTLRQFQAFGCEDPPDAEMLELVRAITSGIRETGDWRSRIRKIDN